MRRTVAPYGLEDWYRDMLVVGIMVRRKRFDEAREHLDAIHRLADEPFRGRASSMLFMLDLCDPPKQRVV